MLFADGPFFWPERAREAIAEALVRSELVAPGVANVLSFVLAGCIALVAIVGPCVAVAAAVVRQARADEARERGGASMPDRRPADPRRPPVLPDGIEADACELVPLEGDTARAFEVTCLRLVRAGRVAMAPAEMGEGGVSLKLVKAPDEEDALGRACADILFRSGRSGTFFDLVSLGGADERQVRGLLETYRRALDRAAEREHLARRTAPKNEGRFDRRDVLCLVVTFLLAVWLSAALPAPTTMVMLGAGWAVLIVCEVRYRRRRSLEPRGARLLDVLEEVSAWIARAAVDGVTPELTDDEVGRLVEFAVVAGVDDAVLARLAQHVGTRGVGGVLMPFAERADAKEAAVLTSDPRWQRAAKESGKGSVLAPATCLRAFFAVTDAWVRSKEST